MTNPRRSVRSQCPYCGVGCGLELLPPAVKGEAVKRDAEGNPMWTARGDREHPSSLGQVCIKGATVGETLARGRLRQPLYRQTLEDDFTPISWDDALNKITGQIQASVARRGNADFAKLLQLKAALARRGVRLLARFDSLFMRLYAPRATIPSGMSSTGSISHASRSHGSSSVGM